MRIRIEAEGRRFTIPIPLGIILNGFTTKMIMNHLKNYGDPFTEEQLRALFKELKKAKKTFPKLPLVDVQSADGQRVLITL